MRQRRWTTEVVTGLGCIGILAGCGAAARTVAPPPPALVGTELNHQVPTALLNLPMTDQDGARVTLGSFRGKIVVVSDMMTLCQETCAIGTAAMLQAARVVDHAGLTREIEFLSITIDPGRDDRRHLAAYRRLFGSVPNWELLTGASHDINELWNRLGVWRHTVRLTPPYPRDWLTHRPATVDIQHSDDLIFIDRGSRFRFEIDGPGAVHSAKTLPARIYRFMDALGHRNVRDPSAGSWSAAQVLSVLRWLADEGGQ
jgi:cytochrome oxidase Cu insertion factor (SCO1/SenC/PrrC family)